MLDAISAESLKFARHRATWFLVWIYPIAFVAGSLLSMGVDLVRPDGPAGAPEAAASWVRETATVWRAPISTFGRYLISAFAAVVFAGEYGWNTWKLVIPHRPRWILMAAKYVTALGLLYGAFLLAGVTSGLLSWVDHIVNDDPLPAGITLGALIEAQCLGALKALPSVLLTLAYTSLAAVLTRSTVAALVIGIVIVTVEELFLKLAPPLSAFVPDLAAFISVVFHGSPGYHLKNLESWISEGEALAMMFPERGPVASPWGTSLAVAAAWIAGLAALAVASFQRQDIN